MRIPKFIKKLTAKKPKPIEVSSDNSRIQREINYSERIRRANPRLKILRNRVGIQRRRSSRGK